MIKLIANWPANKILLSHPFALFPSVGIRSAWSLQNMRRVLHACVEFYVTKSACTRQFWQRISKVSRSVIYIIRPKSFITSAPGAQNFFWYTMWNLVMIAQLNLDLTKSVRPENCFVNSKTLKPRRRIYIYIYNKQKKIYSLHAPALIV